MSRFFAAEAVTRALALGRLRRIWPIISKGVGGRVTLWGDIDAEQRAYVFASFPLAVDSH